MKVKCDDRELELTDAYMQSIKDLMKACILMMREAEPEMGEYWYYGVCTISDFMHASGHRFVFGGEEDMPATFKTDSQIWIVVPF